MNIIATAAEILGTLDAAASRFEPGLMRDRHSLFELVEPVEDNLDLCRGRELILRGGDQAEKPIRSRIETPMEPFQPSCAGVRCHRASSQIGNSGLSAQRAG